MVKKFLYLIIIIVLIIAGVFVAQQSVEENKTIIQTDANILENINKNEGSDITEKQNLGNQNNSDELQENKIEEDNNVQTGTTQEKLEEKAKKIVQEDWGEDDSVYYSYDGINSEGKYIICVRDKSTTKALFWYYVDMETGEFNIK